ncbi:hypothetical protein ACFPM0_02350 [Pseudonocardia sulfidoxydans]
MHAGKQRGPAQFCADLAHGRARVPKSHTIVVCAVPTVPVP